VEDFGLGDADDHLALSADGERMDGVGDPRLQERRDPLAVEEALHHRRLGLVTVIDVDQVAFIPALGAHAGKRNDLAATSRHGVMLPRTAHCHTYMVRYGI
jgi:hypothetical protein